MTYTWSSFKFRNWKSLSGQIDLKRKRSLLDEDFENVAQGQITIFSHEMGP
jgi:hypothetical protein